MILSEVNFQVKDHHTLIELGAEGGKSRPLAWRRSLNYLSFEASAFTIDVTHWINESDRLSRIKVDSDAASDVVVPLVKSSLRSKISVSTRVDLEKTRDKLYRTVEANGDDKRCSVAREGLAKKLILSLSEGEVKSEDWGVFKAGAFYGCAGFYDDGSDLTLEVTASKDAILDLVQVISSGHLDRVIFNVVISSFSSEVDDALRDWHHSRDLIVHGFSTPAALESMVVRRKEVGFRVDDEAVLSVDSQANVRSNLSIDGSQNVGFLVKDLVFDAAPLKSIKVALWAVVVVLFLSVLK